MAKIVEWMDRGTRDGFRQVEIKLSCGHLVARTFPPGASLAEIEKGVGAEHECLKCIKDGKPLGRPSVSELCRKLVLNVRGEGLFFRELPSQEEAIEYAEFLLHRFFGEERQVVNITQNFAQGVDPDRIARVFREDAAKLANPKRTINLYLDYLDAAISSDPVVREALTEATTLSHYDGAAIRVECLPRTGWCLNFTASRAQPPLDPVEYQMALPFDPSTWREDARRLANEMLANAKLRGEP